METSFNCTDREKGYISSDERKWVNKVRKLKEQHPDEVRVIREPEQNDGCIYAEIPVSWFAIRPPVKRVLTDEQRQEMSERMKSMKRTSSETRYGIEKNNPITPV